MSALSPIEQSCRKCGYGRRVDGTIVEALPGIVCPGHDFQTHQTSMKTYLSIVYCIIPFYYFISCTEFSFSLFSAAQVQPAAATGE